MDGGNGDGGGDDDDAYDRASFVEAACAALALLAVSYAPASHVLLPVGFVVAERTLFLPSAGACLLAALAPRALAPTSPAPAPNPTSAPGTASATSAVAAAATRAFAFWDAAATAVRPKLGLLFGGWRWRVVAVAVLAARTCGRASEWRSEEALLAADRRALPHSPALLYEWGLLHARKAAQAQAAALEAALAVQAAGWEAEAEWAYRAALRAEPRYHDAYANLGQATGMKIGKGGAGGCPNESVVESLREHMRNE